MKKIIVLIIVVIVAVIGFFVVKAFFKKTPLPQEQAPSAISESQIKSNLETKPKTEITKTKDTDVVLVSRLTTQVRFFIESYGTYSSDSNFSNLKALFPQMTERFKSQTIARINQEKNESANFYSYITKAVNLQVSSFNPEQKVVFLIQAQEIENKENVTTRNQRIIEVVLLKEGGNWKVDAVNYKQEE